MLHFCAIYPPPPPPPPPTKGGRDQSHQSVDEPWQSAMNSFLTLHKSAQRVSLQNNNTSVFDNFASRISTVKTQRQLKTKMVFSLQEAILVTSAQLPQLETSERREGVPAKTVTKKTKGILIKELCLL